jgi:hypothetical protein
METDNISISAPPDSIYISYYKAYSALQQHRLQNGYGFNPKRSWPHNMPIKTRYYYSYNRRESYLSQASV